MERFRSQITVHETSVVQRAYGRSTTEYAVDITLYTGGKPASEFDNARTVALAETMYTRPGIGGSRVAAVQYEGIQGTHEVPSQFNPAKTTVYDVHRWTVRVETSGCD